MMKSKKEDGALQTYDREERFLSTDQMEGARLAERFLKDFEAEYRKRLKEKQTMSQQPSK